MYFPGFLLNDPSKTTAIKCTLECLMRYTFSICDLRHVFSSFSFFKLISIAQRMNHRLVIRASLDGYFMYSFLGKSSINSVHVLALFYCVSVLLGKINHNETTFEAFDYYY